MKVLVFLQNAWSPQWAGKEWPRRSWLRALRKSRSGKRLAVMEKSLGNCRVHYDNTTPKVGDNPDSIFPPDHGHMRRVVASVRPSLIVACGKQAYKAVLAIEPEVPVLIIPHPSYRVVTNELFLRAAQTVLDGFQGVRVVEQGRGEVVVRDHQR